MRYIPIKKLIYGGVYIIDARNFGIGIWDEIEKAFYGRKITFGLVYLFPEDHWDLGYPHGTARPFKFIEMPPRNINNDDMKLEYLWNKEKQYSDLIERYGERYQYRNKKRLKIAK